MKIERKEYFDKLIGYKDKKIIKVITGVRRCGKSTLLSMFQDYLRTQSITDEQIIYINFEDYESRNYFDRQLRQSGLFDRLEQMGIQEGDTVSLYDLEFEYIR